MLLRSASAYVEPRGHLMKKLLLLLAASSVLAATSTAATAAPPPSLPDGPDLAAMALAAGDFSGAKVMAQKYVQEAGTVAAYERELELRGRLLLASSSVSLYGNDAAAKLDLTQIRRGIATPAGRAAFGSAMRSQLRGLKVKSLTVSAPVTVAAGNAAFRFGVVVVTNVGRLHLSLSFVRVDRALALVFLMATPNRTVSVAESRRVALIQASRLRAGFVVGNVTAPAVTGEAFNGRTLSATRGRWAGGPTQYAYQWSRCDAAGANCVDIAGATGATYAITTDDVGSTVRVRVRGSNALAELAAESPPTPLVS
jgi:hypothetical protein